MACSWDHPGYFGVVVPVFHVGWWDVWASIHEPGHVQEISSLPFLAFVLDVFLGDSSCLLGWNVEVFLLCLLRCVRDFWCSPYVVPESVCFLFVWHIFFLVIVVSEVGVHSSGLCVEHSICIVLFWQCTSEVCEIWLSTSALHLLLLISDILSCYTDSLSLPVFLAFLFLHSPFCWWFCFLAFFSMVVWILSVCSDCFLCGCMTCYYFRCGVYESVSFCDILCMYHMDCMISFSCQLHD